MPSRQTICELRKPSAPAWGTRLKLPPNPNHRPQAPEHSSAEEYTFRPMRKVVFQFLFFIGLCSGILLAASNAQTLLVVNQGDSNVSLVDPASAREVATIAEKIPGVHGHEIAVSADGHTAFLPIYGDTGVGKPGIDGHEMLLIDVPSHKIV